MEWRHSESGQRPIETEHINNGRVYIRRNIVSEEREGATMWKYEECLMSESEYAEYMDAKATSKIDYVAMMTDVELPDEVLQ